MGQEQKGNGKAEDALGLALELARGLTMYPGKVACEVSRGPSTWRLKLTVANDSDAKRVVGRGGNHIRALTAVAKMAFRRAGLTVELDKVAAAGTEPEGFAEYKPLDDWPRERLRGLVDRAARLCLPGRGWELEERDRDEGTAIVVRVRGASDGDTKALGLALAVLMLPIGATAGRRIHSDVVTD